MRAISHKVKADLQADPRMSICALLDKNCDGKITWEHAIIFAGRQLDEAWAILGICEWHHSVNKHQDGGGLVKDRNVWVALNRATDSELLAISKAIDYIAMRKYLNNKYGSRI